MVDEPLLPQAEWPEYRCHLRDSEDESDSEEETASEEETDAEEEWLFEQSLEGKYTQMLNTSV
jgi:hypothetical protein